MRHRSVLVVACCLVLLASASCAKSDSAPKLDKTQTGGAAPVVSVSRSQRPRANLDDGQPGDHIHAAFGVYDCDHFLDPVTDQHPDVLGIHTHGDGIIHIHPFSEEAAGPNARIRLFFADTDIKVSGGDLQVGDTNAKVGTTTCAGKPAELVLAYWRDGENASKHAPDRLYTRLLGDAPLNQDLSAYTLAFVSKGAKIPPPPTAKTVRELGSADQ